MKIIPKNQAREFKNEDSCVAIEYSIDDPDINTAIIAISGRYPAHGFAINKICKEIAYVIEGKGAVNINGIENVISKGDMVFIEPNEKFSWEGELILGMSCAPAWSPEQHHFVE